MARVMVMRIIRRSLVAAEFYRVVGHAGFYVRDEGGKNIPGVVVNINRYFCHAGLDWDVSTDYGICYDKVTHSICMSNTDLYVYEGAAGLVGGVIQDINDDRTGREHFPVRNMDCPRLLFSGVVMLCRLLRPESHILTVLVVITPIQ